MNDNTSPQVPTSTTSTDNLAVVTEEQLQSIGINLPPDQMQALIQHTEDTIAEQIGEEVVESLDDEQLAQLLEMQKNDTPAELVETWVAERVEDYREIVADNTAIVLGDLASNAEAIVASAA